jgi:Ca2+-binding RTX toxin-like protein
MGGLMSALLSRAQRRGSRTVAPAFVDPLEPRRLFAVQAAEVDGTLVVAGDASNDAVYISYDDVAGSLTVSAADVGQPLVDILVIPNASILCAIDVGVAGGNDWVYLGVGVAPPAVLHGGSGEDFLQGGDGDDEIYGDDDKLYADGGSGNDKIYGGSDEDTIYGGSGNDELYGYGSPDLLGGGDNDDTIDGGAGADTMYGDDGDDTFNGCADGYQDFIYGGDEGGAGDTIDAQEYGDAINDIENGVD